MSKKPSGPASDAASHDALAKHASAVLAMGNVYYLLACGIALASVTGVALRPWRGVLSPELTWWSAGVFIALAVLSAAVGRGFRRFAGWAPFGAGAIALLCCASFFVNPEIKHPLIFSILLVRVFALPVGAVVAVYGAYLALSKKGRDLFARRAADKGKTGAPAEPPAYTYSKVFLALALLVSTAQALRVLTFFVGPLR